MNTTTPACVWDVGATVVGGILCHVTNARKGLSEDTLAAQPLAGGLSTF